MDRRSKEGQSQACYPHSFLLFMKALLWQVAVWLLAILALFLFAGTPSWPAGWIFLILFFGFVFGLSLWLLKHNPALLAERLVIIRQDQPAWDRMWVLCFYLLSLTWLSLMPLDAVRWHWSNMPAFFQVLGLFLLFCSLLGIFLTIRENHYLSPLVRLQRERGHTLISTGPYAHLRHPLYSSAFLFYTGTSLLLGSWWGLGCAPVFIGLMVWRAVQEERFLRHGLPGYHVYMIKVKRRFIPGIW
jgi:protein-S-isoprenylcysteine O-methyltransferase Ste14